ncbi:MAG: hypothetical protein M0042_02475 [Nitrospiraceae bacterium]|nr:hypothetical protein [Nitrospiraceae bacterium]
MLERLSPGDPIVSYCTKCKQSMDHAVVTMEGAAIGKVRCRTCGGNHKYSDPSKARTTRTRKKGVVPAAVLWQACLAQARGKEHLYTVSGRYRVGDIVLHDKFGKGVVRKLSPNRCTVLFEDKERLMASAN